MDENVPTAPSDNDGNGYIKRAEKFKKSLIMQAIRSNLLAALLEISEYTVQFKFQRFLIQILYHLIFFFGGPLIILIIWLFESYDMVIN